MASINNNTQAELNELYERISEAEKLYRFSEKEEFKAVEKLFEEAIRILDSVKTIKRNFDIEVRARQIAVSVIDGLLDSVRDSKEEVKQLEKDIKQVENNNNEPQRSIYK